MQITFHGAAKTVTGSKHLLTLQNGYTILLDCGLFQGEGDQSDIWNSDFGFDVSTINTVILSHAHIDHTGLLPKLVKEGFKGVIWCSHATKDLLSYMLMDSAYIQESDIKRINKKRLIKEQPALEPLYNVKDVENCIQLITCVKEEVYRTIHANCDIFLTPMAHILGSNAITLKVTENDKTQIFTFSGDIGRPNDRLLIGPNPLPISDFLVIESTYGNKLHPAVLDAEKELHAIVYETCVKNNGKLIIPAFSLDRTQELIYLLDRMSFENKLPAIPVYIDSPLSVKVTDIMRNYKMQFTPKALSHVMRDGDPFNFPNLHYVSSLEDSKKINSSQEACIIISASGMANAGRIKHHIANNVHLPNTTILLVGYASPNSLAGKLKQGDKKVRIFGEEFNVNCQVKSLNCFSAHADYTEMLELIKPLLQNKPKNVFLVHGEEPDMLVWKSYLENAGFENIFIPNKGQTFLLS